MAYKGSFILQFKVELVLIVANIMTTVISYIENRLFKDWFFLESLIIIMVVNFVLSLYQKWKIKLPKSPVVYDFLERFILYACGLIATNVLVTARVAGEQLVLFNFLDNFILSMILVVECGGVYKNIVDIRPEWDKIFGKAKRILFKQIEDDGKV